MAIRIRLLSSVSIVALVTGISASAFAADPYALPAGPAVSAPNGKASVFAGTVGGDFTLGSSGSLAFPLASQWGAQIDGMVGTAGGGTFYGVGGHAFWRDPSRGLLGVTASYVGWGASTVSDAPDPIDSFQDFAGAEVGKLGVEGEAYLGRVSLEGAAAYQFGSYSGLAAKGTLAFYPTDNLRLDLTASQLAGRGGAVSAGLEWAPRATGFTVFANAGSGGDAWHALGGVKMYFGDPNKSLIRRHREDDPDNTLPDDLYRATSSPYCAAGEHSDGTACVPDPN